MVSAETVEANIGFSPTDVAALLPAGPRSSRDWSPRDFAGARRDLQALAGQICEVSGEAGPLVATAVDVTLVSANSINFHLVYPRPDRRLEVRSLVMDRLPPGHRDFLSVSDSRGALLLEKLMGASDEAAEISLPRLTVSAAQPSRGAVFFGFLRLGVEHIWTGYDHLLFLFGLLVVCRSFRSIAGIITCFTLAHSLTLALATLGLVNLPSHLVEPAIAASIVFVGIENLLRRGREPVGRWALTFAFGLIHGFGFASVLRELGVGRNGAGVALPLFTFNLGVELGQISIAALVLPIVWQLRKNEAFVRRAIPALSAVVAALGLYWFLLRTAFA